MKGIVTCRQMKEMDAYTIEKMGVPSLVLMERAALAVTEKLLEQPESLRKVLVVCGMGNNGGDGIAVARLLHQKGICCQVYLLGNPDRMTAETKQQYEIAKNYGVGFVNNLHPEEYTTIVDALFGVGLHRKVEGDCARLLSALNAARARRVAVDVPSGISGDTGQVLGTAFMARETVTFAFGKPGLYLAPGCAYAGEVTVAEIGILENEKERPGRFLLEPSDARKWLPKRDTYGNKGTFGKALLLVSQKSMAGAGCLCAGACFATGAGMVKLHSFEENRVIFQTAVPEAMVTAQEAGKLDFSLLDGDLRWCDAIAAGPGLGTGEESWQLLRHLLAHRTQPMVLDADALNLISCHSEARGLIRKGDILTPHLGEMSRLTGRSISDIQENLPEAALALHGETGAVCVLKDARTWIAAGKDHQYVSTAGNDGMATAGSGDVLSGILAGLLASGMEAEQAAPLGVLLHGMAGDAASRKKGRRGMRAGDLPKALCQVLREIEE